MKKDALSDLLCFAKRHWLYAGLQGDAEDLRSWPFLSRDELRRRLESRAQDQDFYLGAYLSPTSGTRGQSLLIPSNVDENHLQRKQLAPYLLAEGIFTPSTLMLNLFGTGWMARSSEIFTEFAERCGATSAPLGPYAADNVVADWIRVLHPNLLAGVPSRLSAFAAYCKRMSLDLPRVASILFAGEFLQPSERHLITAQLGATRFSAVYGSAEVGIIGFSEGSCGGSRYRIPGELAFVELTDQEEDGGGELVVTNLIRRRTPMIRYRTGDRAKLIDVNDHETTIELLARESDLLAINGTVIRSKSFEDAVTSVLRMQVQVDPTESGVRLIFRLGYPSDATEQDRQRNEAGLRGIVTKAGVDTPVEINFDHTGSFTAVGPQNKIPKFIDKRGGQSV